MFHQSVVKFVKLLFFSKTDDKANILRAHDYQVLSLRQYFEWKRAILGHQKSQNQLDFLLLFFSAHHTSVSLHFRSTLIGNQRMNLTS